MTPERRDRLSAVSHPNTEVDEDVYVAVYASPWRGGRRIRGALPTDTCAVGAARALPCACSHGVSEPYAAPRRTSSPTSAP